MDWQTIISIIFGTGGISGVIAAWKYRRENRQLKQNEVTKSDTDTQSEQINLGSKFIEQSFEAVKMIQASTGSINEQIKVLTETMAKNQQDVEAISKKMTMMSRDNKAQGKRLSLIEKYLNGQYKSWKESQKKGGGNDTAAAE